MNTFDGEKGSEFLAEGLYEHLGDEYSLEQAAQLLHIGESAVLDYIASGQLPNARVDTNAGHKHKIPHADLVRLRESDARSLDERVRAAAMLWLEQRSGDGAESLHALDLDDFRFEGKPFRLKDITKGIRKPKELEAALSITTVYRKPGKEAPYRDEVGADGLLRYKWEGTDANLFTNRDCGKQWI